ncbi:kelch-like protein 26 [Leptotrombidium deliense]|uniref:Kelch-like protein diablo n=1 Tax=Leptotrombidium deliense TaxID=299467 RepID=A0A443SQT3_9ACAR|nr:kelch-like protein 26 [Leptotrombidium deliense]
MRQLSSNINSSETCEHVELLSHSSVLLRGLNWLRSKSLLVDVTLIAGGDCFDAHRAVLASCSDYFRAMFTGDMKECQESVISLNGVSSQGMSALIEYAYTARVTLNLTNVEIILAAASYLQFLDVIEVCSAFLEQQINIENCVDIAFVAEMFSLLRLRKKVYRFISANLLPFSRTVHFQRLSHYQLEYLLSSDFPVDCCESDVLTIVLNWIHFSPKKRMNFAANILSHIHFHELSKEQWKKHEILMKCTSSSFVLKNGAFGGNKTKECAYSDLTDVSSALLNSRGMELAIVKVGGFSGISGVTNEISYYLRSVNKWKYLTSIPHVDQCNFGVTVLWNELFVVGGCYNQSLEENVHPFGFKYNVLNNTWSTIAMMQQERCRFTLSAVNCKIYAIAGAGEINGEYRESCACEVYNPVNDTWTEIAPIVGGCRTQHAAASWNTYLYVCGGLDHDVVLDSVVRYNTLCDMWERKTAMLLPRADHNIHCYKNKLYITGGWYEDELTATRILVDTIDCYDIATDHWETVATIPTRRLHSSSIIFGSQLYIIGGFLSDNTFNKRNSVIECFDIDARCWSSAQEYPEQIWEHCVCTLFVPRCHDDCDLTGKCDQSSSRYPMLGHPTIKANA